MNTEIITLNQERGVSLTAYIQSVGGEFAGLTERPAVVVLPGGGYQSCSERESDHVALAYLKAGYHAFVLRYSLGEHARWPNPLEDYEQAMALIRARAEGWHIAPERIAVIGFSAGGHLAACAATMAKNRPNAAILGYPVIDGENVRDYLGAAPDAAEAVDERTCPCFVFATRTDNLVPVENSVHMIDALCRGGIAFESHIYGNGPHGLSTGDGFLNRPDYCARYPRWVEDSIGWLEDVLGGFGPDGLHEPRFGPRLNGDRDKTLNLDCTLAHLRRFPEARRLMEPLLPGDGRDSRRCAERVLTLGGTLAWFGVDGQTIAELGRKLGEIENTPKNMSED